VPAHQAAHEICYLKQNTAFLFFCCSMLFYADCYPASMQHAIRTSRVAVDSTLPQGYSLGNACVGAICMPKHCPSAWDIPNQKEGSVWCEGIIKEPEVPGDGNS
jgi:hypothetical protein